MGVGKTSFAVFLAMIVLPFLFLGFMSTKILEPRALAQFELQTISATTGVQQRIDYTVSVFGSVNALRDVEPVLDNARVSAPGIDFLAMTDGDGNILHVSAEKPNAVPESLESMIVERSSATDSAVAGIFRSVTGLDLSSGIMGGIGDIFITSLPLGGEDMSVGTLYVGIDTGALDALKRDVWMDTGVIILACLMFAVELLVLVVGVYIIRPAWAMEFLTARLGEMDLRFTVKSFGAGTAKRIMDTLNEAVLGAARALQGVSNSINNVMLPDSGLPRRLNIPMVAAVRLPLFLFFLSEALLRPTLPNFLGSFTPVGSGRDFMTGVIMAGFMAASLFTVLIGSVLSERSGGPRRVFMLGALCSGLGLFGHLIAQDFTSILLLRMLTGFGYGLVYAAGQVHIAAHADPSRRTTGFSLFLAVIVAAEICGPAIGGIVVDRFGQDKVFMAAVFVVVLAGVMCFLLVPALRPDVTSRDGVPEDSSTGSVTGDRSVLSFARQWKIVREILSNQRFAMMILCFSIPAKALLTGGLFLLVPLTVFAAGGGASASARVIMGYGIAILLLVPLLAPLADRWKRFGTWMALGGLVAGVGFVIPHIWNVFSDAGFLVLFVCTLFFGLGQTLSIPTQMSFLLQGAADQVERFGAGTVLGLFRFIERFGSFAGPVIAGGLLLLYPPDIALMWMGMGSMVLAATGLAWLLAVGQQDESEVINELLVAT